MDEIPTLGPRELYSNITQLGKYSENPSRRDLRLTAACPDTCDSLKEKVK